MIYSLLHTLGSFYIDPVRKVRLQFVSCGFSPKQAQMVQTKEANTPLVCTIKYLFVKTLFDLESATSKYPTSKKGEFCGAQLVFIQVFNYIISYIQKALPSIFQAASGRPEFDTVESLNR